MCPTCTMGVLKHPLQLNAVEPQRGAHEYEASKPLCKAKESDNDCSHYFFAKFASTLAVLCL